ncbi:SpoIIE family protein phosphatase [Marinilabilia salmonicolor]|uniref:Serine phosphatase RsbU (Regulator of sigma subunit) n=1 Tax=Marinilabilia salmonicolor TaxID=989 RepID=A0A368VCD0_9BACT|nr:SpoIIE family protein phosphatase [Marinilabilia salmonicolor]RCW38343.1 serine phosphatase RsbU (regulator of sigma subunit) [Marinilabilia salmonicolor]
MHNPFKNKECCPALRLNLKILSLRSTIVRALRVALVVGFILNISGNYHEIINFQFSDINYFSFGLAFLVPYLVSSYSTLITQNRFHPGDISPVDAMLHCNNCDKVDFNIAPGDEIDQCPGCGSHTKWGVKRVNSAPLSGSDMVKSLALFARHNPQPLFRVNQRGTITGVNPAAHEFFNREDLTGNPINEIFSEFPNASEIAQIISSRKTITITVTVNHRVYHLHVRGVPSIQTLNIYCNEITEIIEAHQKIKEQARDINASIEYARRIQTAMLPGKVLLNEILEECFVFFRPLNIVSGDFYWVNKVDNKIVVAVGDCAGHGVPGAIMSMLGMSLLNEIVLREGELSPEVVLNQLRHRLIQSLSQGTGQGKVEDGIDISLIVIEPEKRKLQFAGAYNSLYLFRGKELTELKGDRMPVGNFMHHQAPFNKAEIDLTQNDRLYLFSDGFKDQFGGPNDKKYSTKTFKKTLSDLDGQSCDDQKENLKYAFDKWKGNRPQIDDVTVFGMLVK